MKRRSFLQPTSKTGVFGQKRRISGNHMALQLRNDFGLPIEKHSSTTSDLSWKIKSIKTRCFHHVVRTRESYTISTNRSYVLNVLVWWIFSPFLVVSSSTSDAVAESGWEREKERVAYNIWSIKATNEKGLRQQQQQRHKVNLIIHKRPFKHARTQRTERRSLRLLQIKNFASFPSFLSLLLRKMKICNQVSFRRFYSLSKTWQLVDGW